ncbi:MAG: hypothetical protein U0271_16920 [Polyangiaceae bacterium]
MKIVAAPIIGLTITVLLQACTLFDEPPSIDGGAGGSGGAGDGGASTCLEESPACLLPELEAARLCAFIATCPTAPASIAMSTGIPIGQVNPDGTLLDLNFSACVNWLTLPLQGASAGYLSATDTLNCFAGSMDCEGARFCGPYRQIAADDPRCNTPTDVRCDDEVLVDCPSSRVTNCKGLSFAVTTGCEVGKSGVPMCRLGDCSGPGQIDCEENPPGSEYSIACDANGDELGLSCTGYGLSCEPGLGCAQASGVSAACAEPFAQSCGVANRLHSCSVPQGIDGWMQSEIDCEAIGLECVEVGQSAFCAGAADACTPYDAGVNVCDPDAPALIHLCVGGQPTTFDCATLGYTCVPAGEPGKSARCGI